MRFLQGALKFLYDYYLNFISRIFSTKIWNFLKKFVPLKERTFAFRTSKWNFSPNLWTQKLIRTHWRKKLLICIQNTTKQNRKRKTLNTKWRSWRYIVIITSIHLLAVTISTFNYIWVESKRMHICQISCHFTGSLQTLIVNLILKRFLWNLRTLKRIDGNHNFSLLSLFYTYFFDTLYLMNRIVWLSDENLDISRRFRKNLFKIKFTIRVWSDPVKCHDIWQICILLLSTHMCNKIIIHPFKYVEKSLFIYIKWETKNTSITSMTALVFISSNHTQLQEYFHAWLYIYS